MSDARLGILMTADVNKATGNLGILESQLERLQRLASLPNLNFRQQERLNALLQKTTGEMQKFTRAAELASPGITKFTSTTNAATLTMTNFGRVVQDAPFGFLGIANNLNPLIESFGRLKAQTGGNISAFGALSKSLIGPAGVGLAVSVVSSLLIQFGDRLFGSSKAAKEAEEANKKLAESISGDLVKLTTLVGIIQNVNSKQEDRKKALQAINEEYGKYLPNLDKEKVTAENLAVAYDKVVNALLRQAVVKGIQQEIEKTITETATSLIALEKAEEKKRLAQEESDKKLVKVTDSYAKATEQLQRYNKTIRDGNLALQSRANELNAQFETESNVDAIRKRLEDELKRKLAPLLNLTTQFEDLDITLNKITTPNEKDFFEKFFLKAPIPLEPTIDQERFRQVLLNKLPVLFSKSFMDKLSDDIEKLAHAPTINLSPDVVINQQALDQFRRQQKELGNIFGVGNKESPLTLIQQQAVFAAQAITDVLTPAFQQMFSAIAAGTNPIKAFFEGLLGAVQQLIQKLAAAALQALVLSAIFPGGIMGKQGFGQIFGSLLGFRARGGSVTPGNPYIVGEGGVPELFIPRSVGTVVPLGRGGGGFAGGGTQNIVISGELVGRGSDFVAVIAAEVRKQLRVGNG